MFKFWGDTNSQSPKSQPCENCFLLLLKTENRLALWASLRASAQAVTSKWHFRTTSPINTASLAGEN